MYQTDGFGQNRDARRATALGQLERAIGDDGLWRLTTGAYLSDYHAAGVIREDDYLAGRKGFYDTYDFGQGGARQPRVRARRRRVPARRRSRRITSSR